MLSLKQIKKDYQTGDSAVHALNGISLDFRENEFVSILGPSGCGKTTLLNIIGGLDQYTSGDLIINGKSTTQYTDDDWDTYRNHSIGFVFQSYNLIPHQTILSNVELALTLSGVTKSERKRRAIEALKNVGLGDHIHKRPNQLSGGQMQRVAIARALVNNPDILLADEPTGALDTQTSVQIMELLRTISENKLIIMVTHNPELAKRYSNRIIEVLDGRVIHDSMPFTITAQPKKEKPKAEPVLPTNPFHFSQKELKKGQFGGIAKSTPKKSKNKGPKKSMSFLTALSLSLNNLMTKKGRTFMTSFAGSIGIIGIALILSVSTGVNAYIESVQRETLAGYPITLQAEAMDMSELLQSMMGHTQSNGPAHEKDKVYQNVVMSELINSISSTESTTNDLASFKKHLESTDKFDEYVSAVQYAYNFNWSVFVREGNELGENPNGPVVKSDVAGWFYGKGGPQTGMTPPMDSNMNMMGGNFKVWEELLAPTDPENDSLVNDLIKEQYEIIDEGGRWPSAPNEVVLVVNKNNEVSDLSLFALGLRTEAEMNKDFMDAMLGKPIDTSNRLSWTYEEIRQMEFRLILASECFEAKSDGTYKDLSTTKTGREKLYNDSDVGFTLKVVGVIRPREEIDSPIISGSIGYTSALSKEALKRTKDSDLLKHQKDHADLDVLTGLPFQVNGELTVDEKKSEILSYVNTLNEQQAKAFLLTVLAPQPTKEQIASKELELASYPEPMLKAIVQQALIQAGQDDKYTAEEILANPDLKTMFIKAIAITLVQNSLNEEQFGDKTALEMMDMLTDKQIQTLYDDDSMPHKYSESNYIRNLKLLGDVDEASPATIYLYSDSFENKDMVGNLITEYNNSVDEDQQLSYTDYVKMLMSSITTVLNAITYVLIAFVAISLIVSSIMIGIITYISVLERTKEIGILRAIGASKKDVGRVFNAETMIVGFIAGMIGILFTVIINQLINVILFHFTGIVQLKASLPLTAAVILVAISMFLTFIAGLFPSGFAAKKNPVEALRSE